MTQPEHPSARPTEILVILDRSGSMATIAADVVGGVNTFLDEQRRNGPDARVTIVQFDSQDPQHVLVDAVPIAEVTPFDIRHFRPRGGTPLLDALGRAVGRLRADRTAGSLAGSPRDVIVAVVTDGAENQSREFTLADVNRLIETCEAEGWNFVYLSADRNAFHDAERMGFKAGAVVQFDHTGAGTREVFGRLASGTAKARDKKRRGEQVDSSEFFSDES